MVGAKIVDGAIGCADSYEVLPCLLERLTTCRSECQMVEMPALKHCGLAVRVLIAGGFDRMQPRVCANAQHRVLHAWHALLEYDFQPEDAGVEGDESLQVPGHDGN